MEIPIGKPERVLKFYQVNPDDYYYVEKDKDHYYYKHKETGKTLCLRR